MNASNTNGVPKAKTPLKRWVMRIIIVLVVLGVVAAVVSAMMPKPVEVEVVSVERAPMVVTVDEDGRTRVKDRYVVSTPLPGTLARIKLQAGDAILAGAEVTHLLPLPVPLLDPQSRAQAKARLAGSEAAHRQAQVAASRAKAAYDFAASEIGSQRILAKQDVISNQELERAELGLRTQKEDLASANFGVRVARHEVDMSRAALGRLGKGGDSNEQMLLGSPVDGVVLQVLQESEGVVQAGTPLVEVGDPKALELVVDVLTTDAVRLKAGAKARILRWGGEGELAAHVRRIEPKAFTRLSSLGVQEQRVNVLLDLDSPQNEWAALGDGFRIEASIVVWQAKDVLKVPVSAVFRRDGKWMVFVFDEDKARMAPVELGNRNGLEAEVVGGLEAGAKVISHPGERVSDGSLVVAR